MHRITYRVILVHLDAVASDEGRFPRGVHQQQQSVGQPEGQSGEHHGAWFHRPERTKFRLKTKDDMMCSFLSQDDRVTSLARTFID